MKIRLFIVKLTFLLLAAVSIWRLYDLQINKGKNYRLKAENQINTINQALLLRGEIYLKSKTDHLTPISISKFFPALYVVPREIEDQQAVEDKIIELFPEIDKEWLKKRLYKKDDPYELIKRRLSSQQEQSVKSWQLKGVYLQEKIERFFPFKEMASHVLGFVSLNNNGQWEGKYGVEKQFEKKLKKGGDIVLTIDKNIQFKSEEILKNLVEKWKAKGGQVIVVESKTGRILAMASLPNFNPNSYSEYPLENFLNPSIENIWEPGSVFKVLTMAAGLDSGAVSPETKYFDKGFVTLNKRTIYNWDKKSHGWQKMADILAKSLNTGAVFVERKIGHKKFLEYLKKFGIGQKTNIDLPDEVVGSLKNLEKKDAREINFATASFGQGVSATPIEMVMAINTIANNGVLLKPIIIDKILSPDGKVEKKFEKTIFRRTIKPKTAKEVTKMMVEAVEHGKIGYIKGYRVAAKTGTAQVPYKGKYLDKYIHTYIGFAPADNPKFTVLVKLDEPQGKILSGATVVPAFRELVVFLLDYFKIPPSE